MNSQNSTGDWVVSSQSGQRQAELEFERANRLVRSRQIHRRQSARAADLISRLFARKGYGQQQSSQQLCEAWTAAVGEPLAASTRVGRLNRRVLEIIVSNSAICHRLNFNKQSLLSRLSERLPQNKIRDLKFRVGNVN
jgi:predicted nucleic acid-binding Zn ribbon protein